MVRLKIIRISFDNIWQKYSKVSRIEFACFSFHVGLFFFQLFAFQTGEKFSFDTLRYEHNANFDSVSSKRGNFDAVQ